MLTGFNPRYDTRAKVRCGIKVNGRPKSVDYFVSDDAEFTSLLGDKPTSLRVLLPYRSADECWSTNLEYWTRTVVACYSDDAQTAHRKTKDGWTIAPTADRQQVACRGEQCPDFTAGNCKMTGRLYFFLADGDRRDSVLQLDTHARGTISQIGATMQSLALEGDLLGRVCTLTVTMEKKGQKQFPVVRLSYEPKGTPTRGADEREQLIAELRRFGKDPRDPDIVAWVKRVGVGRALQLLALKDRP